MRTAVVVVMIVAGACLSRPSAPQAPTVPLVSMHGRTCGITKKGYHRVETAEAWTKLWDSIRTAEMKHRAEIDFTRCTAVAVFQGDGINCDGYEVESIDETADRVRLRIKGRYFQTGEHAALTNAWGVFVLHRTPKLIVVEFDTKLVIADPPKWTKVADLKPGKD